MTFSAAQISALAIFDFIHLKNTKNPGTSFVWKNELQVD
jgi:hypothetical protein